jgi:hypothetical protein
MHKALAGTYSTTGGKKKKGGEEKEGKCLRTQKDK